jgi:hypothetical protein
MAGYAETASTREEGNRTVHTWSLCLRFDMLTGVRSLLNVFFTEILRIIIIIIVIIIIIKYTRIVQTRISPT